MGNNKTFRKKGLILSTTVSLIILVISFVVIFFVILPLFSQEFRVGTEEWWCQTSVALNRQIKLTDALSFPIACSTRRITVSKSTFEKAMTEEDTTLEEGGVRYLFDKMRRCKTLVGGEDELAFFSGRTCYICYTLEMEEDTPTVPVKAFVDFYHSSKTTPGGVPYIVDLQSPGRSNHYHDFLISPNGDEISANKRYAVAYVDNEKPAATMGWLKGLGGCGFGALVAGPWGCVVGGALGGISALVDQLEGVNTNKIVLTDLNNLREGGGFACSGFAY